MIRIFVLALISLAAVAAGLTVRPSASAMGRPAASRVDEEQVCGPLTLTVEPGQSEILWTRDRLYALTCDVAVPQGYTLTIQAGTQIEVRGPYSLSVAGMLVADGTADEPVHFAPGSAALETTSTMLAAGGLHTCILTKTRVVRCWGSNGGGQIGAIAGVSASVPVTVPGLPDAIQLTVGMYHNCTLAGAGSVKCWGINSQGQLGDGSTTWSRTPVDVAGLSDAAALSAGELHTCALTRGRTVKCWGYNEMGQLGDGFTVNRGAPVDVVGIADVTAISTRGNHTCALKSDRTVACWGWNTEGQLGNGTNEDAHTPTPVSDLSDVAAIAAGSAHTCALSSAGRVTCWGANWYGQLGDGSKTNRNTPVEVHGLSDVTAIAAGGYHTCALASTGVVKCWGFNSSGQVGDGTIIHATTPVEVLGLPHRVRSIAAGSEVTCALISDWIASCWGRNDYGQLGNGMYADSSSPVDVLLGNHWKGIVFEPSSESAQVGADGAWSGGSVLRHVSILGADDPVICDASAPALLHIYVDGGIDCRQADGKSVWLRDSVVDGGVHFSGDALVISSSIGMSLAVDGAAIVLNSTANAIAVGAASRVQGAIVADGVLSAGRGSIVANSVVTGVLLADDESIVLSNRVVGGAADSEGMRVGANAIVAGNDVRSASGAALVAGANVTATGNRFVENGAGIAASSGRISGNLIAANAGDGLIVGAATVQRNTFTGNRGRAIVVQGATPLQISENNFEGNLGAYDVYVVVTSSELLEMPGNWWGTTDADAVEARIFDRRADSSLPAVVFSPMRDAPAADAPAYAREVRVLPSTTLIAARVLLQVAFSRDILATHPPTITVRGPVSDVVPYPATVDDLHAVFEIDALSLASKGVYTLDVSGAVGSDGIEIAPSSALTFTVGPGGYVVDQTPPSTPLVTVEGDGSLTRLTLRWATSDAESGVTHYRYAVGTTPGGTDVVNWTTIEAPSSRQAAGEFTVVRSGLNLVRGQTYYGSAQARNAGGLWSEPGVSEPTVGGEVTVLPTPTPTVTSAPGVPTATATPVDLRSKVYVPAVLRR